MEILDCFQAEIHVQAISHMSGLLRVVDDVKLFNSQAESDRFRQLIQQAGLAEDDKFVIGVKRLLNLVEMSRQDADPGSLLEDCDFVCLIVLQPKDSSAV